MKPSRDCEIPEIVPANGTPVTWEQIDAHLEAFPSGNFDGLGRGRNYAQIIQHEGRDEYGRARFTRMMIRVEVREFISVPNDERDTLVSEPCDCPEVAEIEMPSNPDSYHCANCKKIHAHAPYFVPKQAPAKGKP